MIAADECAAGAGDGLVQDGGIGLCDPKRVRAADRCKARAQVQPVEQQL